MPRIVDAGNRAISAETKSKPNINNSVKINRSNSTYTVCACSPVALHIGHTYPWSIGHTTSPRSSRKE